MKLLNLQQQLLDLFHSDVTFDNFIALKNTSAVSLLQSLSTQYIHLAGAKFSGKTHLLQAWVHLASVRGKTAILIRGEQLLADKNNAGDNNPSLPALVLDTLTDTFDCIAIDDIELLDDTQQIELFNLFNQIKLDNRDNLLLTSSSTILTKLPDLREDLKTRLLSGVNLTLHAMDDTEIVEALILYSQHSGIKIGIAEINYLINYYTRNLGLLIKILDELATVAVIERRHITIPLIKTIISKLMQR